MSSFIKSMLILSIAIGLCNCGQKAETHFDAHSVETTVRQMLGEYHDAIQSGGLTAEFDYLDTSRAFFWVPPGYTSALDYDSVHAILTANAAHWSTVEFSWKTLDVYPLSETLASYTGIVAGDMVDTLGMRSQMTIIESGTLIKRPDGWKLLNGQSALLPENQ